MVERIYVTGVQQDAAKAIVRRNAARGIPTRPEIEKIANATMATPEDMRAYRSRFADPAGQTTDG